MTEKPSRNEDEFFAREEAEKLHKLHQERLRHGDKQKAEEEKKLHFMKCPKCGYGLETVKWRSVDVDKCFRCGAITLDDGELEQLAGNEHPDGFVATFSTLFRTK